MPLSEKARIEVYLPDLPRPEYQDLLEAFEQESTLISSGCEQGQGQFFSQPINASETRQLFSRESTTSLYVPRRHEAG